MHTRILFLRSAMCACSIASMTLSGAEAGTDLTLLDKHPLRFVAAGADEFMFNTGLLRGKLRAEGKSRGLSQVIHIPSGLRLDGSVGLFGHYRVFTANHRYGNAAWEWPSTAQLNPDGSVEVTWPHAEDRPFTLRAVYRWAAPNLLDLETTVVARTNLAGFESFLASYFSASFTNAQVLAASANKPDAFLAAEPSAGMWLAFPRDDAAVRLVQDGRWTHPPSPVDWVIMPRYAQPLGVRRAPATGLTAAVMSVRDEAFALLTPHQTESHYSTYLSLLGRDLKPGESARARARLLVGENLSDSDLIQASQEFARQAARN